MTTTTDRRWTATFEMDFAGNVDSIDLDLTPEAGWDRVEDLLRETTKAALRTVGAEYRDFVETFACTLVLHKTTKARGTERDRSFRLSIDERTGRVRADY